MTSPQEKNRETERVLLQPGQVIRPNISNDAAIKLVFNLYGLKVVAIRELDSYDDRNFYVQVSRVILCLLDIFINQLHETVMAVFLFQIFRLRVISPILIYNNCIPMDIF